MFDDWQNIDDNAASIYPDFTSFGYKEATDPLTVFRGAIANSLQGYASQVQAQTKQATRCYRIPKEAEEAVSILKSVSADLKKSYQSVRIRVAQYKARGVKPTVVQVLNFIVPTLMDGIWQVSVVLNPIVGRFYQFHLLICTFILYLLSQISKATVNVAAAASKK